MNRALNVRMLIEQAAAEGSVATGLLRWEFMEEPRPLGVPQQSQSCRAIALRRQEVLTVWERFAAQQRGMTGQRMRGIPTRGFRCPAGQLCRVAQA